MAALYGTVRRDSVVKVTVNARPTDALRTILDPHALHISPLHEDRKTYGIPRPLCSLRINGMKEVYS
jgi:hypothetical protein